MTNNQLAHQANLETSRHNRAMEEVDAKAQAADQRYKEQMAFIEDQKRIWKEKYDKQMLDIENGKVKNMEQANKNLAWYQQQIAGFEQQKIDQTKSHDTVMETLESEKNDITKEYNKALKEYQEKLGIARENEVTIQQFSALSRNYAELRHAYIEQQRFNWDVQYQTAMYQVETMKLKQKDQELILKGLNDLWKNINDSISNFPSFQGNLLLKK